MSDINEVLATVGAIARRLDLVRDGTGEFSKQAQLPAAPPLSPSALAAVREHMLGPLAHYAGALQCRQDATANALLWDVRLAHLREIVALFASRGIRTAPLKGMAYALSTYPDPALRPMSDIDVLVESEAFDACCALLEENGFVHASGAHQRATTHHAMTYKRTGGGRGWGVAVDLHRHITHAGRVNLSADEWWRRAQDGGDTGWRLDPVDALLIHIAHMSRHEFFVPLVNYVDGALLAQRWSQHGEIGELAFVRAAAKQARMERMFSVWHYATYALLGRTRLEDFRSPLGRMSTPSVDQLVGYVPPRWRQIAGKVALCQGPRELAALGKSVLFSTAMRWR